VIELATRLVVWLNALANACGSVLLAPIGLLPGWLSATLVAVVTGVALLAVFKYTSNQRAIKRVKDDIKANLLALKLFNTSAGVALASQVRVIRGALQLLALALVPMLVMAFPVLFLLGQLSLWYQARPLRPGEDALVTLKLRDEAGRSLPDAALEPTSVVDVTVGPVRVPSKHEVCWKIEAREAGRHRLMFRLGDERCEKELVVGEHFMRTSLLRPDWELSDALVHPAEEPFIPESPFRSIAIDYPQRSAWTSGTDSWLVYWFAVSMVSGFAFRGLLNVNM
jgi:hypothetical protein